MNGNIRKLSALAVALAAITLLCTATPARADLTITVQEDGGPVVTVVSVVGSPTSNLNGAGSGTTPNYSYTILSGDSKQTPTLSELLSATVSISATGSTSNVLHIVVTGTGYTSPTAPPPVTVLSDIGGTVAVGGAGNTLGFHSIVDGTTFALQSPSITTAGAYDNSLPGTITSLSAPFTIQETLDIHLDAGGQINYSSSTILSPVPEPASMISLAMGGCILGGIGLLRWRRVILVG